jgi:hypothetical protein
VQQVGWTVHNELTYLIASTQKKQHVIYTELCINLVKLSARPKIGILGAIKREFVPYTAKSETRGSGVSGNRDLEGPDFGQKV